MQHDNGKTWSFSYGVGMAKDTDPNEKDLYPSHTTATQEREEHQTRSRTYGLPRSGTASQRTKGRRARLLRGGFAYL